MLEREWERKNPVDLGRFGPKPRGFQWSPLPDSNRRPPVYKTGALAN